MRIRTHSSVLASVCKTCFKELVLPILLFVSSGTSVHSESYKVQDFLGSDVRIRSKRNATSYDVSTGIKTMNVTPEWRVDLLSGKYYGSEQYLLRKLYIDNPNKSK